VTRVGSKRGTGSARDLRPARTLGTRLLFAALAAWGLAGLAAPAAAERVVIGDTTRFAWAPASGPVSGYRVYIARNGSSDYVFHRATSASTPEVAVTGAPGTSARVRVRAWAFYEDGGVYEGPDSEPSELVHFAAPEPPPGEEPPGDGGGGGGGSSTPDPSLPQLTAGAGGDAVDLRWYESAGDPEVGDFNADGRSDLFFQHETDLDGVGSFWLMRGDGVRRRVLVDYVGDDVEIVGTGRFDSNELTAETDDVLVYSYDTGQFLAWQLEGGLIRGIQAIPIDYALDVIGIADFDGDGGSDLLLSDAIGRLTLALVEAGEPAVTGYLGELGRLELRHLGDLNGDGRADVLLRDDVTGELTIWLMDGATPQALRMLSSPGEDTEIVDLADFDGDGDGDVLLQDTDGSMRVWLLENSSLDSEVELGRVQRGRACGTGDFDGDGTTDLVLCGQDRAVAVWLRGGALD